jgi:hypothetical protein
MKAEGFLPSISSQAWVVGLTRWERKIIYLIRVEFTVIYLICVELSLRLQTGLADWTNTWGRRRGRNYIIPATSG